MKSNFVCTLLLAVGNCLASAQSERYVTITAIQIPPANNATNTVTIQETEAAEIMLVVGGNANLSFQKDGATFTDYRVADRSSSSRGTIVQGPATFRLLAQSAQPALLTLKIMPEAYPPDKTIIIAPSTNQVQITLESSTNLVNWASATNGVYGSPDEARFFRIHMQKLD